MGNFWALFRSKIVWTALGLSAAYWVIAYTVDYPHLAELVNSVRLVLAILVVIAYFPIVIEALLTKGPLKNAHHLVLGISLAWTIVSFNSMWGAIGRYYDFSVSLNDSKITGFMVWGMVFAAILHLTAPQEVGNTGGPVRSWRVIAVGIAVGVGIGFVLASAWWQGLRPNW